MKKLLLATHNQGKLKEIKKKLEGTNIKVVSLNDLKILDKIEETGKTYLENAELKARFYGDTTGLPTLGEDSGLEIDALGGEPGVYTARYSEGSDKDKCRFILKKIKNEKNRKCRYRAVMFFYDPKKTTTFNSEGILEGEIAKEPKGTGGFGHDPIFYLPDRKKTVAEIGLEEKNKISHRHNALEKILPKIIDYLNK